MPTVFEVSIMWRTCMLVVVACVFVTQAAPSAAPGHAPVTTRPSGGRTLDRKAAELAWRTWLQSPESTNPNAPPRRITTKSLFVQLPFICPSGHRLDANGCAKEIIVEKGEHNNRQLSELNHLISTTEFDYDYDNGPESMHKEINQQASVKDEVYDYRDKEPGPLQFTIAIGQEPQAASLVNAPDSKAHETQQNHVKVDKREQMPNSDAGIEAELEILKFQNNDSKSSDKKSNHNFLNKLLSSFSDKPKRDSSDANSSEQNTLNNTDVGEKEIIFGQVNIDPILKIDQDEVETETPSTTDVHTTTDGTTIQDDIFKNDNTEKPSANAFTTTETAETTTMETEKPKTKIHTLNEGGKAQLKPENEYAGIGEAIKLISRYAEVTTDDDFSKEIKSDSGKDDSVLGTRTKLQHRRNKLKSEYMDKPMNMQYIPKLDKDAPSSSLYPKTVSYYRYPWVAQNSPTPPPDYPFRNLQDYWPGKNLVGGVYNSIHENPRRHHHSFPHNYYRNHGVYYPGGEYQYADRQYAHLQHRSVDPARIGSNPDLYSLLGLRHWFSSKSAAKR